MAGDIEAEHRGCNRGHLGVQHGEHEETTNWTSILRNIIDLSLKPGERRCSLEFGVSVAVRFRDGFCSMTGMSVVATRQPLCQCLNVFLNYYEYLVLCPMLTSAPSPQKEDEKVMLARLSSSSCLR